MICRAQSSIVQRAYVPAGMRCMCPECLGLDAQYPGQGYQLALIPYRQPTPARNVK